MTALDLSAATRVLEIPTAPFSSLAFGDMTFTPSSSPHVVAAIDGIPAIPRSTSDGGQALAGESVSFDVHGAVFVAISGPTTGTAWNVVNFGGAFALGLGQTMIGAAVCHGQNLTGGSPITIDTPHDASVTVYALVNSSTEAFVANSRDGVIATASPSSPASGGVASIPAVESDNGAHILGAWHFNAVEVSQADAIDTMVAIIAQLETGGGSGGPSTIGEAYRATVVQAVFGPVASGLLPSTFWGAWLDSDLSVIVETGIAIPQDTFGPAGVGVTNTAIIDGGLCPASVPAHFALLDAEGGQIVAHAPVTFESPPDEGDELAFAPGALTFAYGG